MRHRFLRPVLLAATAALALSACATATPYGPAGVGSRYGYSDQRVDADRYRINFAGNSVTSREQVEMALLLRAAEVTLESGGDWFSTVQRDTERNVRYQSTYDPWYGGMYGPYWGPSWRYYRAGYWSPWGWGGPYGYGGYGGDLREIDRYEATAEIIVGRGPKPAGDVNAFDAREVVQNIGPRLPRPTPPA
ncbi:CC0125/CC1285 family lipoprotein [Brevundimonas sp.]|uniref:CC0125/CC1285 family lipoprotein n=1 Tax=Brevundimonas sp. TaxID=1871086 RepID=UPI002FC998EC